MGTRGHYKSKRQSQPSLEKVVEDLRRKLFGDIIKGRKLTGRENIMEVISQCHPAFGGKLFRIAYELIRKAVAENYTIFLSVAGPITASDYDTVWMIPFIEKGYIAAFSASDAISYHDAHDAVEGKRKIHAIDLYGDDRVYRDARIIRITDIGFPEEVLFNTDRFLSFVLSQPEFQKSLTTTEYRYQLGRFVYALEQKKKLPHGLVATTFEFDVPGFCPSPADGSTFLEAMKLWVLQNRLEEKLDIPFRLNIDLPKDVYEFCALHYWAQKREGNKKLAYIVCGGGAVKNYLLQPEPALEQVLFVLTKKYDIGVQFTTSPLTEGSLSSANPSEAVTWGKLSKKAKTVSVPGDYTMLMSVIAYAILAERALYEDMLNSRHSGDHEKLFAEIPQSRGFLREPQRLYRKREQAMELLDSAVRRHLPQIRRSLRYSP